MTDSNPRFVSLVGPILVGAVLGFSFGIAIGFSALVGLLSIVAAIQCTEKH